MHKLHLTYKTLILVLALFSSSLVSAKKPTNNVVKFNPYGIFNAYATIPYNIEYRGSYERIVYQDVGYYFSISRLEKYPFLNKRLLFKEHVPWSINYSVGGWGLAGGIKKYLQTYYRAAPKGLYLSPSLSFFWSRFKVDDDADVLFVDDDDFIIQSGDVMRGYRINISTNIGYQFVIHDVFVIDVYAGVGFRANFWDYSLDNPTTQSVFRDIERIGEHTPPNEDGEGGYNADIYPEIYNPELMTDNKYQELKRERNTLTRRVKPAGVYPFFGFDMGFTF